MRRLLAVLALVVLPVVAVPPTEAAPAAAFPRIGEDFVAGRRSFAPLTEADALHRFYESLPPSKEMRELIPRYRAALDEAAEGYDSRIAGAVPASDFDRDGVADLVLYDMTIWRQQTHFDGDTTLAVVSGRTGRQVWRRTFEDVALPSIYWQKVGDRRDGLMLVDYVGTNLAEYGYRFIGLGGDRGDVVYDTTVGNGDGRGGVVQVGGFFDAFAGGGKDVLIARVERVVGLGVGIGGVTPPGIDWTQAYVLDGRTGKVVPVSERELTIGGTPVFAAVGDLDADKRDDYVVFRDGPTEMNGSVVARSVVENKTLWSNTAVPLGWYFGLPEQGDLLGDRLGDLTYVTWLESLLLRLPPVTDELVPFQGAVPGSHAVVLDGKDGVLRRDIADGVGTWYDTVPDVDRDGKRELLGITWTEGPTEFSLALALLPKAGQVERWRTRITVPADFPGVAGGTGWVTWAGDVDADGLVDLWYDLSAGTTSVTVKRSTGLVLLRDGRRLPTRDLPLGGTLDGRGADRFGVAVVKDRATFAMRDGRRGTSFWQVTVAEPGMYTMAYGLRGQRGRCDGVLLVAGPKDRERAGEVWAAMLDGRTGRVRWARALNLRPPAPRVAAPAGPAVGCG